MKKRRTHFFFCLVQIEQSNKGKQAVQEWQYLNDGVQQRQMCDREKILIETKCRTILQRKSTRNAVTFYPYD